MTREQFTQAKKAVIYKCEVNGRTINLYKHTNRASFIDANNCNDEYSFDTVIILK